MGLGGAKRWEGKEILKPSYVGDKPQISIRGANPTIHHVYI